MTEPVFGVESPQTDERTSIEPWLRPVLAAGLLGGAADCLGAALLYNLYLRVYSAINPPLWGSRPIPTLATFLSTRAFVFAMGWAGVFAIIYGMQAPIRRRMKSVSGFATVAAAFGTAMWLVMRTMIVRGNLEEPALSLVGWLTYALCVAPAIIWGIRRWAPLASPG
jgi:hypothetical protein